jgi:hypothetical protein
MTTPCSPGVQMIGQCPGLLRICVRPGALLSDAVQLTDHITGDPVDWPVGMSAWLQVKSGAFDETYPMVVDSSYLEIEVLGTETALWPRRACLTIWLQYADKPSPVVWLEGALDGGGCC